MTVYKYRINEIKLNLKEDKKYLVDKLAKKASIKKTDIIDYEIVRESIDARKKPDIKLVYTIDFTSKRKLRFDLAPNRTYIKPEENLCKDKKIIVVGFGPCGMFSSLILAQMGYKTIIIERGRDVDSRTEDVEKFWNEGVLNENSNVQFGEGGAGTFSDGKLTTGISDYRIYKVLKEFNRAGAPDDILYKHKPHIGTDLLKNVVKNIRKEIINLGGEILFSTKLTDINLNDEKITSIIVENENGSQKLSCDHLILAIGHSARDTFDMLYKRGLAMSQKHFSMGVRIEHPQSLINKAQYGDEKISEILGAAEYKLSYKSKSGRGVYTFCMCPGGEVVMASSSKNHLLTNGMSLHARDSEYANAGLLVDIRKEDFESTHPLAGVYFQEKYEKKAYEVAGEYKLESYSIEEFPSSKLAEALPEYVVEDIIEALPFMGRRIKGFDGSSAVLKGPETRSSSPVRFERDDSYRSNISNLYPAGEGAGYAGGIMSAAVDGIKIAESIISSK